MENIITKQLVLETAKTCGTKGEFTRKHMALFKFAKREGFLDEFFSDMPETKTKFSKEILRTESQKYTTRYAFKQNAGNFYEAARRLGLLDEVCAHMLPLRLSFGQKVCEQLFNTLFDEAGIYNDRITIQPLEIDIFYKNRKVAIEYQGQRWHLSERALINDAKKKTRCEKNNILLITIYEQKNSHDNQIPLIKQQVKNQLNIINAFCNTSFSKSQIDNIQIDPTNIYDTVSLDKMKETISMYSSLKDFAKKQPGLNACIRKIQRLDLLNHFRERTFPIKWKLMTDEEIVSLITQNVSSFTEFCKNETFRTIMRRRNLREKIIAHFLVQNAQ